MTDETDRISVLIADDHPFVREGLRSMLRNDRIEVVGEAADGREAVEQTQQLQPDIVLMDVRMPDLDGLAATHLVKQVRPETAVVIVTGYESADYLKRAIQAGAAGYVLKGIPQAALISTLVTVKSGGCVIDPAVLRQVMAELACEPPHQVDPSLLNRLTPRELEVLRYVIRGLTNKEIAREMHYSVGTVKNVVQRIIEKLEASDRTQAAVYAVRAGFWPD